MNTRHREIDHLAFYGYRNTRRNIGDQRAHAIENASGLKRGEQLLHDAIVEAVGLVDIHGEYRQFAHLVDGHVVLK